MRPELADQLPSALCCPGRGRLRASGPAERFRMTVVAASVRTRGGHRLCAGRRHRGGGGRVRTHRAGTEALGQRLDTVSPDRRPATRYRFLAASSPADPGLQRAHHAKTRPPDGDDTGDGPSRCCGGDMSTPQKCPPTRHYLQTTSDNRRSVADSASPIELSRARRSGCSASCWPGCSFTVGVVTSCWKVASLELAFASVAGCRSWIHLRRSGTRSRSPARRSAAGDGCGIVIRERPLGNLQLSCSGSATMRPSGPRT